MLKTNDKNKRKQRNYHSRNMCLSDMRYDGNNVLKKWPLINMKTEQFWNLVYHDNQADACFETRQHRVGDKVSNKTKTQNAGEEKKNADEYRQCRCGC